MNISVFRGHHARPDLQPEGGMGGRRKCPQSPLNVNHNVAVSCNPRMKMLHCAVLRYEAPVIPPYIFSFPLAMRS